MEIEQVRPPAFMLSPLGFRARQARPSGLPVTQHYQTRDTEHKGPGTVSGLEPLVTYQRVWTPTRNYAAELTGLQPDTFTLKPDFNRISYGPCVLYPTYIYH